MGSAKRFYWAGHLSETSFLSFKNYSPTFLHFHILTAYKRGSTARMGKLEKFEHIFFLFFFSLFVMEWQWLAVNAGVTVALCTAGQSPGLAWPVRPVTQSRTLSPQMLLMRTPVVGLAMVEKSCLLMSTCGSRLRRDCSAASVSRPNTSRCCRHSICDRTR